MATKLLTETLNQIFNELELDELFSCILVNRKWCQIAIPILWSDPWKNIDTYIAFSYNYGNIKKYVLLISTYISCLSEDDRNIILNLSDIPSSNLLTRPFFDYPIFLR